MIIRSDETQDVEVPGNGTMRMHLFRPAIDGRFPGILLFSEIYQVTAPIRRRMSRWLATLPSAPQARLRQEALAEGLDRLVERGGDLVREVADELELDVRGPL